MYLCVLSLLLSISVFFKSLRCLEIIPLEHPGCPHRHKYYVGMRLLNLFYPLNLKHIYIIF